jgi:beta-glucanase (GH16 family)
MKNIITLLFVSFLFFFQLSFSQQLPIDFSDVSDNFLDWGGSAFKKVPSPTDSNNTVGEFFRANSSGGQGYYIDLAQPIDLDVENSIKIKFYAFDSNSHAVIVKLEREGNSSVELGVTVTSEENWTELSFNYASIAGSGTYSRLTIIIDNGSAVSGTFLIDDISGFNDDSTPNPNELDVVYNDLVWSDEFNYTDNEQIKTKWHHQTIGPNGGRWFNNEEQIYTDNEDNSFVENGSLNITAIKLDAPVTINNLDLNYTSARLNSKFAFTYGRVDVRAKLPEGNGTWPAIWTLGKNVSEIGGYFYDDFGTTSWPACGEIDIMEHGLGAVNHTSSALHTPSSFGNTVNTKSQVISDVVNNWHVYSVNWSPNQITFLVDGIGFYTYNPFKNTSTWPFTEDQYILLNVAMGGIAGTVDSGFTQSSMIIDYVRVYQNTQLSTAKVEASKFKVYPNPAVSEINIQTDLNINKLELYDILGKLILKETKITKSIKLNNLKPGMYLLNIYSGTSKVVKKVIVN